MMAKMEKQSARCRVDDIAATFVIPRRFRFFVWVTLNERKWVTLAERRGMSERCVGEIWVIIVGKPKLVASSGEDDRLFQRARSQKQCLDSSGFHPLERGSSY